jgi:hypothetical protein
MILFGWYLMKWGILNFRFVGSWGSW